MKKKQTTFVSEWIKDGEGGTPRLHVFACNRPARKFFLKERRKGRGDPTRDIVQPMPWKAMRLPEGQKIYFAGDEQVVPEHRKQGKRHANKQLMALQGKKWGR